MHEALAKSGLPFHNIPLPGSHTNTHTHTHTHTPDSVSRQHGGNQPWPCGRFSVSSSPAPVRGLGNDAAAATFPVWGPTGEEKEVGREREREREVGVRGSKDGGW